MIEHIGKIEDDKSLLDEPQVVICGCGRIGKKVLTFLESNLENKEIVFCDVDEKKQGTKESGIDIISYEEAIESYHDACFVIANLQVRVVMEKLIDADIKIIHIVR